MARKETSEHWLDRYATDYTSWKQVNRSDGKSFKRPLGLLETSFDIDGTHYGGRADMTCMYTLAMQHTLSRSELRHRIALAWTSMRLQHVLLMSRVVDDAETGKRGFWIDAPNSAAEAVESVEKGIVWVEDMYKDIDDKEFHHHAFNVGRIVEPTKCMSKLHVLPLKQQSDGTFLMHFLIIIGHQISDGLSAYNWLSHFLRILNTPSPVIEASIAQDILPESIEPRLPRAQEDLYPPITGSVARQRWFWVLIRVLRHVAKTLPPTFVNPLRRPQRLGRAVPLPHRFDKLFNYDPDVVPPLSTARIGVSLSKAASTRLLSLCRSADVSIGAGCFALVGLSMMELHESSSPSSDQYPAFAATFPLNPRAFFVNPPPTESCMLAFSQGIVMPFLPSDLPVERRFKLVAKQANRGLRVYQKRLKGKMSVDGVFDKHSPLRLLATGYLTQMERVQSKLPSQLRNTTTLDPQGDLKPRVGQYEGTCGVSSIGSLASFFERGTYDLQNMEDKDFAVDFRDVQMGVRARDNEFLVGISTNAEGVISFRASYDMNAVSQEAAEIWAKKISGLLEKEDGAKL